MALNGVKFAGKNLSVSVGGTVIDSTVVKSCTLDENQDMLDSTGAGGGGKTYLPGETNHTATFEFWMSDLNADLYDLFTDSAAGDSGEAYIVYPNSSSSGEQSCTFYGFASTTSLGVEKNSTVPFSVSVQITGEIVWAVI